MLSKDVEKQVVLMRIIHFLKQKELSIAELQREVNLKRSTLIYYIQQLEAQGLVTRERVEKKKTGRPSILKFNKDIWEKKKEELEKKFKEDEERTRQEILRNPLTLKVLRLIKDSPKIDLKDILSNEQIKNYVRKFEIINWLHQNRLIVESFHLTEEGEAFLKEHDKQKT